MLNRRLFMSKSSATLLAATLASKDSVVASQGAKTAAGKLSDEFLSRLPQMMELANVPGLSAAIIKDGSVSWARSFGVKDATTRVAADSETLFGAGSLSKPVFAYAVMKLREEKLIDLDRPLVSYLSASDLPDDPRTKLITARHALSHSTGWQNWRFRPGDKLQFAFNPGERFSYSGEGIFLLQRVAEQITGRGFEDFMRERVFQPLGMKRSSYIRQPEHEANLAMGHNARGNPSEFGTPQQRQKLQELAKEWNKPISAWRYEDLVRAMSQASPELPSFPNFMSPNAAGSLLTTASEYAGFIIRLMDKPPGGAAGLGEASRREMLTSQQKINAAISWGLGIGLETEQDRTCFWHWGDNGTYKAFTFGDPLQRSGVVVLTNGANGHKIWQRVAAEATGRDHAAFLFWMV